MWENCGLDEATGNIPRIRLVGAPNGLLGGVPVKHRNVRREIPRLRFHQGAVKVIIPEVGNIRWRPIFERRSVSFIGPRSAEHWESGKAAIVRKKAACHSFSALRTGVESDPNKKGGSCSIGATLPCKQGVAGASPVSSTNKFQLRGECWFSRGFHTPFDTGSIPVPATTLRERQVQDR